MLTLFLLVTGATRSSLPQSGGKASAALSQKQKGGSSSGCQGWAPDLHKCSCAAKAQGMLRKMTELTLDSFERHLLFDQSCWAIFPSGQYPAPGELVADLATERMPRGLKSEIIGLLHKKYGLVARDHDVGDSVRQNFYNVIRIASLGNNKQVELLRAAFHLCNRNAWLQNTIVQRNGGGTVSAWNLPLLGMSAEQCVYLVTQLQDFKIPFQLINSLSLAGVVLGDKAEGITIEVLRVRGDEAIRKLTASFPSLARCARRPPSVPQLTTVAACL